MTTIISKLKIPNTIKKVNADAFEDAVLIANKKDGYGFYLNSELIDVNDRFRIFKYNGVNFISKRINSHHNIKELELARKAEKIINDMEIDNYILRVIVPKMVSIDNNSFLVSKYEGTSLQELLYSNEMKNELPLSVLLNILNKFLQMGICYRGFLPRNTIIKDKIIYLLDWEDAVFSNNVVPGINLSWKTNFILNWGYLYDVKNMEKEMTCFFNNKVQEPPLIKYEENFKNWLMSSKMDVTLRREIYDIVLFSESKLLEKNDVFCIMPNDLAHLISDIFNSDIDILFDISTYVIRKKNEKIYNQLNIVLSNYIVDLLYNKRNIQSHSILILLICFDLACNNKLDFNLQYSDLNQMDKDLKTSKYPLLQSYYEDYPLFKKLLFNTIETIFINYGSNINTALFSNLAEYIWSFK